MNPFTEIDYASSWVELQKARRAPDNSAYWDKRSENYGGRRPSGYADQFIGKIGLDPDDTVFDMGCGTGAIALPLARAGHRVIAADFSQGMLDRMPEDARRDAAGGVTGLDNITVHRFSWEDDWAAQGVTEKCVDVAVASRSMAVADLGRAIDKLTAVARKKVAVTLSTDGNPRCNSTILHAIGRESVSEYDAIFAINILWQKGLHPSVSYIDAPRVSRHATRQEAIDHARETLEPMTEAERRRFASFSDEHLVEVEEDGLRWWMFDYKRQPTWAHIMWDAS